MSPPPDEVAPRLDRAGRLRMRAPISLGVVGFYLVLIAILLYAASRNTFSSIPDATVLLVAIFLVFLARYASTHYVLDSDSLHARRLFGSRTVKLEEIRKIEFANLRDLGPVSFLGGWGWRGRMWSPIVGTFDSIHTVSPGLLVTAGAVPLFLSPSNPEMFARELSRRARSYNPELGSDSGRVPSFRAGGSVS